MKENLVHTEVTPVIDWVNLLDPAIQLLSLLVGFAIVLYQLRRNHNDTLKVQAENRKNALKVEIHKEFLKPISETFSAIAQASQLPLWVTAELQRYLHLHKLGVRPSTPTITAQSFYEAQKKLLDAELKLISLLQNYEIINSKFKLFRIAISSARYDLAEAYWPYLNKAFRLLPLKNDEGIVRFDLPTEEAINELDNFGKPYSNAAQDMNGYIHDLTIELQKALLGGLFAESEGISIRQPADPNVKVIVIDDDEKYQNLLHYFENEAPSGIADRRARNATLERKQ